MMDWAYLSVSKILNTLSTLFSLTISSLSSALERRLSPSLQWWRFHCHASSQGSHSHICQTKNSLNLLSVSKNPSSLQTCLDNRYSVGHFNFSQISKLLFFYKYISKCYLKELAAHNSHQEFTLDTSNSTILKLQQLSGGGRGWKEENFLYLLL